jgi:hypothetical protein
VGKQVLKDVMVVVNSVNLSDHIDQISVDMAYEEVDTTAFGETAKTRAAGLGDHKVTIEFQQDYDAASVEATIFPLLGQVATIVAKPTSGATSTTNPAYSMSALITQWKPLDGKVGDLAKTSVTWPVSGDVAKATV